MGWKKSLKVIRHRHLYIHFSEYTEPPELISRCHPIWVCTEYTASLYVGEACQRLGVLKLNHLHPYTPGCSLEYQTFLVDLPTNAALKGVDRRCGMVAVHCSQPKKGNAGKGHLEKIRIQHSEVKVEQPGLAPRTASSQSRPFRPLKVS